MEFRFDTPETFDALIIFIAEVEYREGVLNFELGTDVRSKVSTTPINRPEKMQICNLYLNHLFLEGLFLNKLVLFTM